MKRSSRQAGRNMVEIQRESTGGAARVELQGQVEPPAEQLDYRSHAAKFRAGLDGPRLVHGCQSLYSRD